MENYSFLLWKVSEITTLEIDGYVVEHERCVATTTKEVLQEEGPVAVKGFRRGLESIPQHVPGERQSKKKFQICDRTLDGAHHCLAPN